MSDYGSKNHFPEEVNAAGWSHPDDCDWDAPEPDPWHMDPAWDCPDRWYADPEAAAEYIRWSESLPMAEWPGGEEPPW